MSKIPSSTKLAVSVAIAVSVWAFSSTATLAQHHMHGHGAHSSHQHAVDSAHDHNQAIDAGDPGGPISRPGPHGGQVSVAGPYHFEVVYRPRESRVYLYDADFRPIRSMGTQAEAIMKVRSYRKAYRYPLTHVAPEAGPDLHEYLALAVNVGRIKDGEMTVTFEMTNLPDLQQPEATFTQTFALSQTSTQPVWTCSMHPQIKVPKPGKCPICSMNLIPLSNVSMAATSQPRLQPPHSGHVTPSGPQHSSDAAGSHSSSDAGHSHSSDAGHDHQADGGHSHSSDSGHSHGGSGHCKSSKCKH